MILWCITGFSRNSIPHSLVIWRHLWRKINHLLKLVYENLQLWDNNPITHRKENWIRRGKNNTRMPIGTVASMTALNPAIQQELGDIIFDYAKGWADDIVIDLQKKMSMWTLWCQWWRYWIMQASAEVSTNEMCCIHVSLLGNGTDARCYYSLCSITEPITEPLKYGRKLKWLSRLFKKPQTQIVGTTVFSQKCLQHLGAWFRKSNKDKVTKKNEFTSQVVNEATCEKKRKSTVKNSISYCPRVSRKGYLSLFGSHTWTMSVHLLSSLEIASWQGDSVVEWCQNMTTHAPTMSRITHFVLRECRKNEHNQMMNCQLLKRH